MVFIQEEVEEGNSGGEANLPSSQGSISPPLGELAEVNQVGSREAMGWDISCRVLQFFFCFRPTQSP